MKIFEYVVSLLTVIAIFIFPILALLVIWSDSELFTKLLSTDCIIWFIGYCIIGYNDW